MLTDDELARLRALATNVRHENRTWTPHFTLHGDPYVVGCHEDGQSRGLFGLICTVTTGPRDYGKSLAEYIAAADPDTIVRLLDEVDRLRALLDPAAWREDRDTAFIHGLEAVGASDESIAVARKAVQP